VLLSTLLGIFLLTINTRGSEASFSNVNVINLFPFLLFRALEVRSGWWMLHMPCSNSCSSTGFTYFARRLPTVRLFFVVYFCAFCVPMHVILSNFNLFVQWLFHVLNLNRNPIFRALFGWRGGAELIRHHIGCSVACYIAIRLVDTYKSIMHDRACSTMQNGFITSKSITDFIYLSILVLFIFVKLSSQNFFCHHKSTLNWSAASPLLFFFFPHCGLEIWPKPTSSFYT
jgi:hypothetical protein